MKINIKAETAPQPRVGNLIPGQLFVFAGRLYVRNYDDQGEDSPAINLSENRTTRFTPSTQVMLVKSIEVTV